MRSERYRIRCQSVYLTEDQEETKEIATAEVANGGEPAGLYKGEPIVDEEWPG